MGNRKLFLRYFAGFIISGLFFANAALAANWYVRPSGGSGAGTNWTAAWNNLNGINWGLVSPGDTIWVAGGTYTGQLIFGANGTSGSRIFVRRARSDASECTGATGWSSGFDSDVIQSPSTPSPMIHFSSGKYITVSGRTTASGGSNGWRLDRTTVNSGTGIQSYGTSAAENNTIEYMTLQGMLTHNHPGDQRAVEFVGGGNGHTLSHLNIVDWESAIYLVGMSNTTIEYCDISRIYTNGPAHANTIIQWDASSGTVIRHNRFHDELGEGIFFEQTGNVSNVKIYGNIFYDTDKVIEIYSNVPNLTVYNNTFANISWAIYTGGMWGAGSVERNNLYYNVGTVYGAPTRSNNLNTSANPFVNLAGKDYHIINTVGADYPRNAGTALAAEYATDRDAVTRGADGTWDIGAYEYGAATPATPPTTPGPLQVR